MKHRLKLKEKRELAELYGKHIDMPPQEMLEQMFFDDSRIMVCRNYYSDSPGYYGDIVWVVGGDSCYMTCFQKKDEGGWFIKYEIYENELAAYLENGKNWTNKNMNDLIKMYAIKGDI
jgi:hypothetical protein|tara:strand:+ start:1294 stop:1647 length:354 start_codon:yes stop_codon:yes gene_type:complete